MRLLHAAKEFLEPAEQDQRVIMGQLFLNTYVRLASKAVADNKKLWRTRPKLHMFHHIVLQRRQSMRNPVMNSCWMDEDAIKRFFKIKKTTHKRQASFNCLRRWLLGLPVVLGKAIGGT